MTEPQLTIGYSVLGERAAAIRLPEPRPDVEILVVVQGEVPDDSPRRDDVRYEVLSSRGVTKSRNAVLDGARGRYVLFADDDIVFHEEGVRAVLGELEDDPELALVLAAAVDQRG
jgi:glycosyltransferase involved in cell wall biosynthesis